MKIGLTCVLALGLLAAGSYGGETDVQITLNAGIHSLGGNVRGFGILAEYPAGGPGKLELTRMTTPGHVEKTRDYSGFSTICSLRIFAPDGTLVKFVDLGVQKTKKQTFRVDVPKGSAGIWRFSVANGLSTDSYSIRFPKTDIWGFRGEMAFKPGKNFPEKWYLYIPEKSSFLLTEVFGNIRRPFGDVEVSFNGKTICTQTPGRRFMGSVKKGLPHGKAVLVSLCSMEGKALVFDGVPGLLCPTPEAALKLKGGLRDVEGITVAGPLQERARRVLLKLKPEDFKVELKFADRIPADLKNPQLECQVFGKYAPISGLDSAMKHQVLDPKSPYFGSNADLKSPGTPDWQTGYNGGVKSPFSAAGIASAYSIPARLNPGYKNRGLLNRAVAAAFYHFVRMQGDDILRENDFFRNSYPQTHAFFVYDALADTYELLHKDLDPETREVFKQCVMALGDKAASFQAYVSNQWCDVMTGHLRVYLATGEKRFRDYFEKAMLAYIDNQFGPDSTHGLHKTGFFLEAFGPDGNYDHLNAYSLATAYFKYRQLPDADRTLVRKMHDGIQRNLYYKSFHWLPQPDGRVTAPNALNCRTFSYVAIPGYPGDYLAGREFDLGYTRFMMNPLPARGPGAAGTFPHLANSDELALRLIKMGLERKSTWMNNRDFMGQWASGIYHIYSLPRTAKRVELPFEKKYGVWELPGQLAWKNGGLYGLIFYDVVGTSEKRILQGITSGGPLVLWSRELGNTLVSMRNAKANAVKTPADVTWTGVFGKDAKGALVFSGKERNHLKWIEKEKSFRITANLRQTKGTLEWLYAMHPGKLNLTVSLNAPDLRDAVLNLPFSTENKAQFGAVDRGSFSMELGGERMTVRWPEPLFAELTGSLDSSVRVLRIRFPADGKIPLVFEFNQKNRR